MLLHADDICLLFLKSSKFLWCSSTSASLFLLRILLDAYGTLSCFVLLLGCGLLVLVLSTPVEDKPFKLEFIFFFVMTGGCETVIAFVLVLALTVLAGSESHPPMLNKENYVPWSSRLLRYAKSRPNGKLIHNSILNGPYVRKMISKPGDANREITTILLGLPEDIYAAVDSCETAQEIWLRVQQMMKGSDIGIQEKKAKLFNKWERFTSNDGESIESYYYRFLKLMNDL
nr:hypothetical protein [Tanacetum cinerariifolium]